jgi:hypothetical protein
VTRTERNVNPLVDRGGSKSARSLSRESTGAAGRRAPPAVDAVARVLSSQHSCSPRHHLGDIATSGFRCQIFAALCSD